MQTQYSHINMTIKNENIHTLYDMIFKNDKYDTLNMQNICVHVQGEMQQSYTIVYTTIKYVVKTIKSS